MLLDFGDQMGTDWYVQRGKTPSLAGFEVTLCNYSECLRIHFSRMYEIMYKLTLNVPRRQLYCIPIWQMATSSVKLVWHPKRADSASRLHYRPGVEFTK
jgi:hypothetical protein